MAWSSVADTHLYPSLDGKAIAYGHFSSPAGGSFFIPLPLAGHSSFLSRVAGHSSFLSRVAGEVSLAKQVTERGFGSSGKNLPIFQAVRSPSPSFASCDAKSTSPDSRARKAICDCLALDGGEEPHCTPVQKLRDLLTRSWLPARRRHLSRGRQRSRPASGMTGVRRVWQQKRSSICCLNLFTQ